MNNEGAKKISEETKNSFNFVKDVFESKSLLKNAQFKRIVKTVCFIWQNFKF